MRLSQESDYAGVGWDSCAVTSSGAGYACPQRAGRVARQLRPGGLRARAHCNGSCLPRQTRDGIGSGAAAAMDLRRCCAVLGQIVRAHTPSSRLH